MQLHATDRDEDKKLFYHLHATQDPSSLALFRIDSISGNVIVTQRLILKRLRSIYSSFLLRIKERLEKETMPR